jgi:hypothetical protein
MVLRRLTIATCALAALLGVAACGNDKKQGVDEPAREGLAIPMGGIHYNVYITRELNLAITPDKAYYAGPEPGPDQTLYGVFIVACNNSDQTHPTASEFTVIDSQGHKFEPTPLPEDNPFAYQPQDLAPQECIPQSGSVAQLGPTAASMILFRLPLSNTENRPLLLEVQNPSSGEPRKVTFTLDL